MGSDSAYGEPFYVMAKKKAYIARDVIDDETSLVVFGIDAAEAKKNAYRFGEFDNFLDIRVRRDRSFDRFATADKTYLEFGENEEADRVFRETLWYNTDERMCYECWLAEFETVPESILDEDGLCAECRRNKND